MTLSTLRQPRNAYRLWARIHRRYVTTTEWVRMGRLSLEFTRIADPDRVLDEVANDVDLRERLTGRRDDNHHLHLPYWAELWDSALGVGQFLTKVRTDKGTRGPGDQGIRAAARSVSLSPCLPVPLSSPASVLDLGCGMGLAGTVAAALGARVLFADIEPSALLFARLNSLPWASRVRTRRLDWRTDELAETFDLILGADILYERSQWEFLEPFWRRHLARRGTVLIGEPGRQTGDLFPDWIARRGWRICVSEEQLATRQRPIRIFQLVTM